MPDHLVSLRDKLATEIPVTQHLGLEVVSYDDTGLKLAAPLSKNVNHEGTAFAGSVNAVATLAGWGWVWLTLRELGHSGHIVLQDSAVDYLKPIKTDFIARCVPSSETEISRLVAGVTRHGRGRVALTVEIRTGEVLAARFRGRYVARAVSSGGRSPRP